MLINLNYQKKFVKSFLKQFVLEQGERNAVGVRVRFCQQEDKGL